MNDRELLKQNVTITAPVQNVIQKRGAANWPFPKAANNQRRLENKQMHFLES